MRRLPIQQTAVLGSKKSSTSRKAHLRKVRKNSSKRAQEKEPYQNQPRNNASAAGQGSTQTPVADVPANGYKDGT